MKTRMMLCALLCATVLFAGSALASHHEEAAKPAAATKAEPVAQAEKAAEKGQAASEAAAMEQWMKLNAPGEAHKTLAGLAGEWTFESKTWMAPGAPPSVSKGTAKTEMVLGGRYLRENVNGDMMGTPFEGESMLAYDNIKKKYLATWIDNMSTGIYVSEGTYDPATKSIVMTGSTFDPMAGKEVPVRTVTRLVDDTKHVFEWYQPGPDGKETMSMEITYTRK